MVNGRGRVKERRFERGDAHDTGRCAERCSGERVSFFQSSEDVDVGG